MKARALVALAACVLLLAGPHAAPAQEAPTRIISLVPAATEMLYAIGAGPRVVAVSSYDHFPPAVEKLPRVGALLDPDLERILSLRPDLVVIYGSQSDLNRQLSAAGIGVFGFVHGGIADAFTTIEQLGARTGDEASATALVTRLKDQLQQVRARVAGEPRPHTLLIFDRTPFALRGLLASGGIGFLNDELEAAGGDNVFADVKRESLPVSTEMVIARRPDVIIELHYGSPMSAADLARDRDSWNVLSAVPAVQHHRVYVLFGNDLVSAGPRLAEATERLARVLHP
ncbi:MAG TPA: helical backbone metal receptor [Vicinamibacterales bacterium]